MRLWVDGRGGWLQFLGENASASEWVTRRLMVVMLPLSSSYHIVYVGYFAIYTVSSRLH